MARWGDEEEWARLASAEGCTICREGLANPVAELECSTLAMGDGEPGPPLPGTCALFFRRHAVELHELSPEEAGAFIRDVQRVSAALQEASEAVKMNYEVHGNTIPHLHMHFFPRYRADPFENGPIDPRADPPPGALERHREIRRRVMELLAV